MSAEFDSDDDVKPPQVMLKDEDLKIKVEYTTLEPSVSGLIPEDFPDSRTGYVGYACKYCGMLFATAELLEVHLPMNHYSSKTGENDLRCELCDKTYGSLKSLQKHQHYKHRYSHQCKAYQGFEMVAQLTEHVASSAISKMLCYICGKMSKTQMSLRNHLKHKHPDMKTNCCSMCHREFVTEHILLNHAKHLHPNGLVCGICSKKISSVAALQRHILNMHSVDGHRCIQCKKKFASQSRLSRHLTKNHNVVVFDGAKYNCGVCDASFKSCDTLIKHVIAKHSCIMESKSATE